jgi:DNA-binding transcriptional LysR family regulator
MRDHLSELRVFLAVVEARSFTGAAARLGTSQSAVSNTVQRLEEALGVRLLNRTTRRVAPTEAGTRLAAGLESSFDRINQELTALSAYRDQPSGLVRISTSAQVAQSVLWPKLSPFLATYAQLEIELVVNAAFTDIIGEGLDAGVRLGESIDQDMIAVRIGPDKSLPVVASPDYIARAGIPAHPRDLLSHACINLRLETRGNLYAWEFERDGKPLNVRVPGRITFNTPVLCRKACLDGHGFACLIDDFVAEDLAAGRLVQVLHDWTPTFPGYHLYYPSRRQPSRAMALVIEALRYRAAGQ